MFVTVLAWACLGLSGCSLFEKNKSGADRPTSALNTGGPPPARFPGAGDPLLGSRPGNSQGNSSQASQSEPGGIIAGSVLDHFNRHPQEAFVDYVCLDEPKGQEAPISVAVSPQGFFTIRGLQPNRAYKLTARAKYGDRMIAGTTYAKAPDIHVVIRLNEDFVTPSTPGLPGPPAYTPKKSAEDKKTTLLPPQGPATGQGQTTVQGPAAVQGPAWTPANSVPGFPGATAPDLPIRMNVPGPATSPPSSDPAYPPSPAYPPGIADPRKDWPPLIKTPVLPPDDPKAPTSDLKSSAVSPARVPSCQLVGKQLLNLALNDLNGDGWEAKAQRKGKLLLLDFWATHCLPCRETMPQLIDLQYRYGQGGHGLEIVGIACENSGSPLEQAHRVNRICQQFRTNYRQLLGSGSNCPVCKQFAIRYLPTLVLLDENGYIVWRHEGQLDRASLEELDFQLQRRLGR